MKKNHIGLGLSFLLVVAMLLASCTTTKSSSTTTSTKTTTATKTTISTTPPTSAVVTTTPSTTAAMGNWWDSLGTPTYGGTITIRDPNDITTWDPYSSPGADDITDIYLDHLTGDIWTQDPAIYNYQMDWRPPEFVTGNLAKSYEFTSPSSIVFHLRQGIHWQNLPPANGREFVASDVVANYQRMFGAGAGPGSPYYSWYMEWKMLTSVTATDNYTVVFQWSTSNSGLISQLLDSADGANSIQCPDVVKQDGNLNNWHHAIGTGPFMVTDFVSGSSATLVRNPNYWAMDERYPANHLPYVNGISVLILPDDSTALAAMRTGKLDNMYGMSNAQAEQMKKSNPEILQTSVYGGATLAVVPRNDKAPFTDIKVREALQMSINLADIATNYYGGNCSPNPSSLTNMYLTGWGYPYSDWPQDLKATYDYNVPGAKALLTAAGLPNGFHTDCVSTSDYDQNLLLIVKNDFAAINVTMDITLMDKAQWTSFVRQNHSEDALSYGGSVLGESFEPTFQMGQFVTNGSGNIGIVSDPVYDALYAKSFKSTSMDDYKQIVMDANKEAAEQHFAISLLTPNTFAFSQPWLKGYSGQAFAADYSAGAPMYGAFYLSRFWIDQTLKKSLGHSD